MCCAAAALLRHSREIGPSDCLLPLHELAPIYRIDVADCHQIDLGKV